METPTGLVVYADIVFLVNFLMDALILWAAGKLTHCRAKVWRLAVGGAAMALLYCAALFIAPLSAVPRWVLSLWIVSTGICAAFGPKKARDFGKLAVAAFVCAIVLGGLGMSLLFSGGMSGTAKILSLTAGGFYAAFRVGFVWLDRRVLKRRLCLDVEIFYGENRARFRALVDTGHSLRDPLTACPVIIAEAESLRGFIPPEMAGGDFDKVLEAAQTVGLEGRLRVIPFQSLGRQNGLLVGFCPDAVRITTDKETKNVAGAVVGIYGARLCGDGAYQGLMGPEIIGNT